MEFFLSLCGAIAGMLFCYLVRVVPAVLKYLFQIWRECRDFNYAAYSDGGGRISEGQACRQADGSWKIWKAKEINQHDSPGWDTGEPQLVPTSPLEPEEDGDSPGWDTGEPQLVPTSPLEPEEDGEG